MIITVRRPGWQLCWPGPWTGFSARTGPRAAAAKAAGLYEQLLAAEPHATAERKRELRTEAVAVSQPALAVGQVLIAGVFGQLRFCGVEYRTGLDA